MTTRQILIGEAGSGKTYAAQHHVGSLPGVVAVDGGVSQAFPDEPALPQIAWVVLLRQDAQSVADWADRFDLSANNQAWLTRAALGHVLLIVPHPIFGAQRWVCWVDPTRGIITDGSLNAIGYRPKAR